MSMNWVHCSAPIAGQVANRLMLSPENGQPLCSMGHVPQQLDVSLYGSPVATARDNMGQYPQVQGIPQAQKPVVQSSGFANSFLRDQFTASPVQVSVPQGAFISSQRFPGKNMFGEVPNQGLNSGMLSGNVHEGNSPQTNTSMKEFSGRQELNSWPAMRQKSTEHGPHGLVPLDPMEEKILYNMEDNSWDVSLGRRPDTVGFGNMLENTDLANSLPSIQSGSWSALMQSAMAEASSSDTGLQEEWSGLTFQKTEQSTANQLSNFMKIDNQQTGWVDNNLQSASSFSSKALNTINDSSLSSSFPGFQQAGIQFPIELTEGLRQGCSHESMEKRPKVTGEWIDCNPAQKPSIGGSQQVQSFMHSNNAWAGQIFEHSESEVHKLRTASHREDSQTKFSAVPYSVVARQATSQVRESNQSEYMGHADISVDNREKETIGKSPQQIGNGSHVYNNSYGGEGETYEKQKNYYQSENSNGSYSSKRLSGLEQGYSGQFQFFSHASSNSINLEQGCLPHFRGNSRASEEVPSKGDLTSVGSDSSNVATQASQNMLELLHKVDQSRDDGNIAPLGSSACNTLAKVPEAETGKSGVQLYNQPSTSQGFGLRLGPPSQRLPNSSHFLSSHGMPQTVTYPNSRQVNSELRDKSHTWVASPSPVQTLPLAHELSQGAHWDDKSNTSVQTGTFAYSNVQGNSVPGFMHGPTYIKSQPHMQFRSGSPVASQSSQATLPSTGNRYPHFLASQDASQQMCANNLVQQFPVLDAVPVSQPGPGMSQQGDMSARPRNVWTNVPIQRQSSFTEPLEVSSNSPSFMDPSNNNTINTPKGGYGSSEFGPGSQQQISSEIDTSQTAGLIHGSKASSKHISDVSALPSGSMVAHPPQYDLDRAKNDDNHAHAATRRNLASVGPSLDSSSNLHQNYTLLDQVRAMKNVETNPSKRGSGVPHDSLSSRDIKMMSFLTEKADDPHARASKGDFTSVGSDSSNVATQASQNMLELLHKVDQSRDNGSVGPLGSSACNTLAKVPEAKTGKSGVQLYNQPSTSQGFGLRLGPPSQRLPNSSHFLSSQGLPQTVTYQNSRQVNSELGENNQTLVASPSSVQTLPLSHELSQRAHGDDKSNASVQTGTFAYSNMQGNSATAFMHGPTYIKSQPHIQFRSGSPVASQSSQALLPSPGNRYPHFLASQDASRQIGTNHLVQPFPILEAVPVSQPLVLPGISQQGDMSARPHNVWTNVPVQRQPSFSEPLKVSSNSSSPMDPSNYTTINTSTGGNGSSEFGSASQQQISSEMLGTSQHGSKASSKYISDASALPSGSLVAHPPQQDLDRVKNDDNHAHEATRRNLASVGHSLDSSPNLHQNYSQLDQVRVLKNVETDPSKRSSGVSHDSFSSRDIKMMSSPLETTDDPRAGALPRPALQDQPSNEMVKGLQDQSSNEMVKSLQDQSSNVMVKFGQKKSESQFGSSNVISDLMEHSQVTRHMVPSRFQQFGTLRNGQMLPMHDHRLVKDDTGQFSQNLHMHASVERGNSADASEGGTVMPCGIANLVGTEHISAPYVLPSDITNKRMAIIRSKKRKSVTIELLPWHKEVTQGFQRPQNMSISEQDWARATNRMMEKVGNEVEMTEDMPPMLRSKRRLILTTQLMQHLLSPPPKFILSANATSHHDGVIYFVSRLALGEACNLTCCTRKDLLVPTDNNNIASGNLKTIEGTGDQQLLNFIEELSARAQKLENDFERVDKTASMVDVRVECQELERFAVINRFAKFHIGGQADTSGTPKPFPQRYVTAHPMPRKLPEGLQCISL